MKVLTITSNDLGVSWGPAIHFIELWNNVTALSDGIVIHAIAPSWTGNRPVIETAFSLSTVRIPSIPSWRQVYYDAVVALRLLVTGRKYDLIYVRLSHWHCLQILVLRMLKYPFAVELNGLANEDSESSRKKSVVRAIIAFQEKWLVSHAVLSIAVSSGIATAVTERYSPKGQLVTIKNGVALRFFPKVYSRLPRAESPTIIYVGTFTPWDGAANVVALARRCPSVSFVMIGDGPVRSTLLDVSPSNVSFPGPVHYSALPTIYKSADAAIVLYEYERHRNVEVSSIKTREYVASGLPIFTTAVPGQEFVQELGVGMLVHGDQDIDEAFDEFLSRLDDYCGAYRQLGLSLVDTMGWAGTAALTIRAIEDLGL